MEVAAVTGLSKVVESSSHLDEADVAGCPAQVCPVIRLGSSLSQLHVAQAGRDQRLF